MLTTKGGLLYIDGKQLSVLQADTQAHKHGYVYAEQLVRALENGDMRQLTIPVFFKENGSVDVNRVHYGADTCVARFLRGQADGEKGKGKTRAVVID